MRPLRPLLAVLTLALMISGCATVSRYDAAGDVHALLIAIRDDDQAGFDRLVDRRALKGSIEARVVRESRKAPVDDGWKALGALLAPTVADVANQLLIQPRVFRSVANYYGYSPDQPIPNRIAIGAALKPLPDGRVCATRKKNGPCLLMFANEGGVWKLSGFEGDLADLKPAR